LIFSLYQALLLIFGRVPINPFLALLLVMLPSHLQLRSSKRVSIQSYSFSACVMHVHPFFTICTMFGTSVQMIHFLCFWWWCHRSICNFLDGPNSLPCRARLSGHFPLFFLMCHARPFFFLHNIFNFRYPRTNNPFYLRCW
jgi:hypothetical protein